MTDTLTIIASHRAIEPRDGYVVGWPQYNLFFDNRGRLVGLAATLDRIAARA